MSIQVLQHHRYSEHSSHASSGMFQYAVLVLLHAFNIPQPPQAAGVVKRKVANQFRKALTTVSVDACRPRFESLRNKMIRQIMVLEYGVPQPKNF